jgi:hypothetical protein
VSGPLSLGRVRARGLAVIGLVFLSGALLGAAIDRLVRGRPHPPSSAELTASAFVPTEDVVANMKMAGTGIPVVYEALQLTPDQRERIRAIMNAMRPATDSLLQESWPRLRTLLDSLQRGVEQVLTAEQRARLAAMRRGDAPRPGVPAPLPNEKGRIPR